MIARLRKRRAAVFTAIAVVVCGLTAGGGAWAYHTRFVVNNCNTNPPQYTSYFTRDGSSTVALYARHDSCL
jgi:hypothetical protein